MESRDTPIEPALHPLVSLLPLGQPFTPAMAARVGIDRTALGRMLRAGVVRRLVRGVYVDATVAPDRDLRARALALVVAPQRVVTGRAAAWLYGVGAADPAGRLETVAASSRVVPARDVTEVAGLRVTTPVRTALDVGRTLAAEDAVAMLDAFLRDGLVRHRELVAALPGVARMRGNVQLRSLVAMADGRAGCRAESVLRLRWYAARLPTPTPRVVVTPGLWLELALPARRFAAALSGRLTQDQLQALQARGWRVVVLPEERLLAADPHFVIGHLEREYLQHLLDQVG